MTDDEIIRLLYERDESGLSAMREKYGGLMMSVSYGILRNKQDAEECESEAVLKAWNSIPPAKPEKLAAYLCRIVRRASLDRYDYNNAAKRNADGPPSSIDELEQAMGLAEYIGGQSNAEELLNEKELTRLLNEFLKSRDRKSRVIFMRRFWFGDTCSETAERLNISESTVRSCISRTLKGLREFLRKEGYDI